MNTFKSKLPKVGTTIFSTMSKMALDYSAINLSQGFPNFPIDPVLEEILAKNARGNFHQYAPMPGNPKLLENVASLISKTHNRELDPSSEILISAGATEGIFATIHALVSQGEEVVVIDPAYDCYDPAIALCGAKCVHVAMDENFNIDWKILREVISQKSRMLILNNPHNPSGRMLSKDDFQQLITLMEDHPNLLLLSDEVYEFIAFEQPHLSAHGHDVLKERSIIVSSFGKTFHITGWKLGYLVAPELLMKEIKKVHQFLVFSVNSIAQQSIAEYLEKVDVFALGNFYQEKRNSFKSLMNSSRFELLACEGTYFQTARYTGISDLPDTQFCEWLVKEIGVAAIPLSVFYDQGKDYKTIRFCFAKTDDTLQQAAEKLCKI